MQRSPPIDKPASVLTLSDRVGRGEKQSASGFFSGADCGRLHPGRCCAGRLSYPSRPIALIVPFGAGGPVDTLARTLIEPMRVSLGQPVLIENVTGASGTIGVGRAVRAAPDGYTVSIGNWPSHVVNGAILPFPTTC